MKLLTPTTRNGWSRIQGLWLPDPDSKLPGSRKARNEGLIIRSHRAFSRWRIWYVDRYGRLLWKDAPANIFHDEGEDYVLSVVFDETETVVAAYSIGLDDRAALAEGDSLPPGNEPSGNGYARQPVNSDATDWTIAPDAGDFQAVSKTVTFTAAAGPIPVAGVVDNMFLSTTSDDTGFLVASVILSAGRTIADGDSLNTDITIKLSE